jgi:phage terminase small subunit
VEKRELAFKLYKDSNGEKPLIEIAKEIGASPGTVRGWKSRYKWDEALGSKTDKTKCSATRSVTKNATPKIVIENEELTEQQKMFCLFYLQHFNATKAYQQAYQVNYQTANAHGYKLLSNEVIKTELHRLKAELQTDIYIGVQDLIKEYINQFSADITDFVKIELTEYEVKDKHGNVIFDKDGNPVTAKYNDVYVESSDNFDGGLVKKISQGKDGIAVELYDKHKAMSELMKYLETDELRKAQIEKVQSEVRRLKIQNGDLDQEEIGDDGFIDAIRGVATDEEVWDDDTIET